LVALAVGLVVLAEGIFNFGDSGGGLALAAVLAGAGATDRAPDLGAAFAAALGAAADVPGFAADLAAGGWALAGVFRGFAVFPGLAFNSRLLAGSSSAGGQGQPDRNVRLPTIVMHKAQGRVMGPVPSSRRASVQA
jgi:hypothetical protein